jgi:hypothetical protein
MIVFEEKFRELISLLPNLEVENGSFPIRYDWGTLDVLNKFLILPENVSKYPLIWLITGKDTEDYISKTVTRKARFVIATRSNDVDQFNETQYQTDFKNILIPVYSNLVTLLERSGITTIINQEIEKELIPNYSLNNNGKGLITIWNAIVVDAEIQINGKRCITQNIKF